MPRNTRPDFKKMMEDKTVIRAFVYCYEKRRNEAGELEEILRTQYGGYEVLIRKDDATLFPYSDALSSIVNPSKNNHVGPSFQTEIQNLLFFLFGKIYFCAKK
ncbi:hypothetical protein SAMN02910369_02238 [Lachnospiraceae bacterium NE2001]|nr:hypothetical protein SAMN02910369_02238 [Lachnospiraceae bacterium NE2001]